MDYNFDSHPFINGAKVITFGGPGYPGPRLLFPLWEVSG